MSDNTSFTISIVAACITLGWIAFNMTQCTINSDTMKAKYPHSYNATTTSTVNAATGQPQPQPQQQQ